MKVEMWQAADKSAHAINGGPDNKSLWGQSQFLCVEFQKGDFTMTSPAILD